MKKLFALPVIGLVLGAVAIATELKTTNPLPAGQQLSGEVITCIKSALEKKETAIYDAVMRYNSGSISALATRKSALIAARGKTTKSGVKSAISAAWKAYKTNMASLKSSLHESRKSAWATYKNTVKACKGTSLLMNVDTSSLASEMN